MSSIVMRIASLDTTVEAATDNKHTGVLKYFQTDQPKPHSGDLPRHVHRQCSHNQEGQNLGHVLQRTERIYSHEPRSFQDVNEQLRCSLKMRRSA